MYVVIDPETSSTGEEIVETFFWGEKFDAICWSIKKKNFAPPT